MKKLIASGTGVLSFFVIVGGLWIGLLRLMPAGVARSIFIIVLGSAFLIAYVWLLIARVRAILAGSERLPLHVLIAAAEILAVLVAFGAVYQQIGIVDGTRPGSPLIHEFWPSVYYSVVTFTTLGYGDLYPQGVGRALAGMQAMTGYIILGLLASTTASVISPHSKAGKGEHGEEDR